MAVGVGKWSEIPGQFPLDEIEIAKNMVSKEDAECEVFFLMNSMDHAHLRTKTQPPRVKLLGRTFHPLQGRSQEIFDPSTTSILMSLLLYVISCNRNMASKYHVLSSCVCALPPLSVAPIQYLLAPLNSL